MLLKTLTAILAFSSSMAMAAGTFRCMSDEHIKDKVGLIVEGVYGHSPGNPLAGNLKVFRAGLGTTISREQVVGYAFGETDLSIDALNRAGSEVYFTLRVTFDQGDSEGYGYARFRMPGIDKMEEFTMTCVLG